MFTRAAVRALPICKCSIVFTRERELPRHAFCASAFVANPAEAAGGDENLGRVNPARALTCERFSGTMEAVVVAIYNGTSKRRVALNSYALRAFRGGCPRRARLASPSILPFVREFSRRAPPWAYQAALPMFR